MNNNYLNLPVKIFPDILEKNSHRLFVFAEARSGSTWLIDTLNSHPEVIMLDEILKPEIQQKYYKEHNSSYRYPGGDVQYIEDHFKGLSGKLNGCKILFPQALRFIDFYEFLQNYRNSNFIILTRKNSVKAEISGLIAKDYSRWHLRNIKDKQAITLNPKFLLERLKWRSWSKQFCIEMLQAHCVNLIQLEYKFLFKEMTESITNLADFLSVSSARFKTSSEIKANPFHLRELLTNYEECCEYFQNFPEYRRMFDDEQN
ncbi:MAG: hypothetical protein HQ541_20685 [Mariniphaga sp.]|nr:hypothetical protein [Mariniphaga sp.]